MRTLRQAAPFILLAACLGLQGAQPTATITRVENRPNGRVRVSLRIQDELGNPLQERDRVRVTLFEDGQEVAAEQLSAGWSVSAVLVLDLSGSMLGDKLEAARQAATQFVAQVPDWYEVAVIGFDARSKVWCAFTSNKALLRSRLRSLAIENPGAGTALHDAVWRAVELLQQREGRRAVVALTDGVDNASRRGQAAVVSFARAADVTVSTIGLGGDVRLRLLREYNTTLGRYFPADRVNQLAALFEGEARALQLEYQLEFLPARPADGSRRRLTAVVDVREPGGSTASRSAEQRYVAPRFIPAVSGSLLPYALVLLGLLLIPAGANASSTVRTVWEVRSRNLVRLAADAKLIGSVDPSGIRFEPGEPVLYCPTARCRKPHHIRSWRLQRCRCAHDKTAAPVCYQRVLPTWARRALDAVSGRRCSAHGRMWLCRCAGDPEGY